MKNKLGFRTAAVLLVLVMVTSCFVGSTFAKYTTSSSGTDNARVAYWGFCGSDSLSFDLFDGEYTHVASSSHSNVFAPGTTKEEYFGIGFSSNFGLNIVGTTEVNYTLNVDAEVSGNYAMLDANPNFKWMLYTNHTNEYTYFGTAEELVYALEALDGSASGAKEYKAGEPIAEVAYGGGYRVGWVWEYETQGERMAAQDKMDTEMGNMEDLENVTITITITATQID